MNLDLLFETQKQLSTLTDFPLQPCSQHVAKFCLNVISKAVQIVSSFSDCLGLPCQVNMGG